MNNLPEIDIIKNILLKCNDKFTISKELYELKHYDDAVSRAYYAVFHILNAVLFTKGLTFSSHKETIGAFNKEFIKTEIFPKKFSEKIKKLFEGRQISDYDVKKYIDKETAEESIKDTEEIISKCKEYLSAIYKVDIEFWNKENNNE